MKKHYIIALGIVILGLLIDRLTKWLVVLMIAHTEVKTLISNLLYLTNHRNFGAAWGILQGKTLFFIFITIIAVGIFVYMAKEIDFKNRKLFSIGITLLIAGALGNFIDRLLYGYVVDFIGVYIIGYKFPIFNVADSLLTIGILMFGIDLMLFDEKKSTKNEA